MRTEYEFVLPRGYVDDGGSVHRHGVMRLATARDELEPLRDPTILGADDPRLTIVVLSRVVKSLGSLPMVTRHEIESLFAADLAYLQDFYGVINFGSEEDIQALLDAQEERSAPPAADETAGKGAAEPAPAAPAPAAAANGSEKAKGEDGEQRPTRPVGRRHAIEEVPSAGR